MKGTEMGPVLNLTMHCMKGIGGEEVEQTFLHPSRYLTI